MVIEKIRKRLENWFYQILLISKIRYYFCRIRFVMLRKKIIFMNARNKDIGANAVDHNLNALINEKASFGMSGRMGLLLYPAAMLLRDRLMPKVLIVGPRTEDDIFFAKALGLRDTIGLDLFSYSKYIDIGDIHATNYPDNYFDAVLLGWMISYSSNPTDVIKECKRIMKVDGILGVGIESNIEYKLSGKMPSNSPRVNELNTANDLINLIKMNAVFIHDPELSKSYDCAVVLKD